MIRWFLRPQAVRTSYMAVDMVTATAIHYEWVYGAPAVNVVKFGVKDKLEEVLADMVADARLLELVEAPDIRLWEGRA